MPRWFSPTASRSWCYRNHFSNSGLRSTITDLGDGTVMHCWVPKTRKDSKPDLLLVHGFGANAMWQWCDVVRLMVPHFNVYVPDLVFFGDSYTTRSDRTESFQARCVMRVMEANGVRRVSVVGLSYGGFVAYSMAAQYGGEVERVVICCAGVCLEEKDLEEGMFRVSDLEEVGRILLPQTADKMRELMSYTFVKPPKIVPSCLLQDFIDVSGSIVHLLCKPGLVCAGKVMFSENIEEKKELIRALAKDRKLSDLPRIPQPTLIIWGEEDQVFPLELGYRLKRHLGDNAQLVTVKKSGHAFIVEKPKELFKHLKSFLIDSFRPTVSPLPNPQNQILTNRGRAS